MFNPCIICKMRYDREYTEKCDAMCEFAKVCLENKKLKEALKQVMKGETNEQRFID